MLRAHHLARLLQALHGRVERVRLLPSARIAAQRSHRQVRVDGVGLGPGAEHGHDPLLQREQRRPVEDTLLRTLQGPAVAQYRLRRRIRIEAPQIGRGLQPPAQQSPGERLLEEKGQDGVAGSVLQHRQALPPLGFRAVLARMRIEHPAAADGGDRGQASGG